MTGDKHFLKNGEMILLALDGQLSDDQFSEFDRQLQEDSSFRQHYLRFMALNTSLGAIDKFPVVRTETEYSPFLDPTVWQALAEHERTAPETIIPKVEPPRELIQKVVYPPREKRKMSKFGIFTLVMSAAAILFVVLFAKFAPVENSYHATIIDSFNAQWGDASKPAGTGSQLSLYDGDRWLQGGYVKLLFDSGAEVVIESPAHFEILSDNELNVLSGRAYSAVPKRAKGFMVHTPNSTVIDLGTEFGIEVLGNSSSVHMIKGKASVIPDSRLHAQKPIELITGYAKTISQNGITRDIRIDEAKFISDISSEMMLIYRGDKAISIGTWDRRLAPDLEKDLHTDGRLVQAINLGPQSKPVTVCGISLGPLPQGDMVSGGSKKPLQVTEHEFYGGPNSDLMSLLTTSRQISKQATSMRIHMKDLEIGQAYRIQLILGFSRRWSDVNCYGVNGEYMYFPNLIKQPKLGLATYCWEAQSSNEKIELVPTTDNWNVAYVFGYILHEVDEIESSPGSI